MRQRRGTRLLKASPVGGGRPTCLGRGLFLALLTAVRYLRHGGWSATTPVEAAWPIPYVQASLARRQRAMGAPDGPAERRRQTTPFPAGGQIRMRESKPVRGWAWSPARVVSPLGLRRSPPAAVVGGLRSGLAPALPRYLGITHNPTPALLAVSNGTRSRGLRRRGCGDFGFPGGPRASRKTFPLPLGSGRLAAAKLSNRLRLELCALPCPRSPLPGFHGKRSHAVLHVSGRPGAEPAPPRPTCLSFHAPLFHSPSHPPVWVLGVSLSRSTRRPPPKAP